jgi:hypothetical protein
MPVPLIINVCVGLTVIVKAFVAKELNMISATSVFAEIPTAVNVLARLNVAVSAAPLGNPVVGVQSESVFQSPPVSFQAALPAKVVFRAESKTNATVARKKMRVVFLRKLRLVFIRLILHWAGPRVDAGKTHASCQALICDGSGQLRFTKSWNSRQSKTVAESGLCRFRIDIRTEIEITAERN